jgi:hypothetical protein
MFENILPSERRGTAFAFAAACLTLLAWAFPNVSRFVTIPGAIGCAVLAVYFFWPEIIAGWSFVIARRLLKVIAAIIIAAAIFGIDYWEYANFEIATSPQPETSAAPPAKPASPEPLPPAPIQSRLSRFIFACDVSLPQTPEQEAKQKEAVQNNVEAWANTLGVVTSFSDIKNGMQIIVEAKTREAKIRFETMGLAPGITKVILESRWIDRRQIVVAYAAELPKRYEIYAGIIPDLSWPQITDAENLVARFLGAPDGACSMI